MLNPLPLSAHVLSSGPGCGCSFKGEGIILIILNSTSSEVPRNQNTWSWTMPGTRLTHDTFSGLMLPKRIFFCLGVAVGMMKGKWTFYFSFLVLVPAPEQEQIILGDLCSFLCFCFQNNILFKISTARWKGEPNESSSVFLLTHGQFQLWI